MSGVSVVVASEIIIVWFAVHSYIVAKIGVVQNCRATICVFQAKHTHKRGELTENVDKQTKNKKYEATKQGEKGIVTRRKWQKATTASKSK